MADKITRNWYRRCGADFIHGTMGLSLEEKGAYSLCLDLIYDHRKPIPDDARWLSGVCGVSIRKWNAIRTRLISEGKLISIDGFIDAPIISEWADLVGEDNGRPAIPSSIKNAVKERDGDVCAYCGCEEGPFHFDHIIPWSRGGLHTVENLTISCASCNFSKGSKTVGEWRGLQ